MVSPLVSFSHVESVRLFVLPRTSVEDMFLCCLAALNFDIPLSLLCAFTSFRRASSAPWKVRVRGTDPSCIFRIEFIVFKKSALMRSFIKDLSFASSS